MSDKPKKRFIAGVVCPKCGEMDKMLAWKQDDVDYRQCVSCGFEDQMRFKNSQRELRTRVNQSSEPVSVVKVLDFPSPEKK